MGRSLPFQVAAGTNLSGSQLYQNQRVQNRKIGTDGITPTRGAFFPLADVLSVSTGRSFGSKLYEPMLRVSSVLLGDPNLSKLGLIASLQDGRRAASFLLDQYPELKAAEHSADQFFTSIEFLAATSSAEEGELQSLLSEWLDGQISVYGAQLLLLEP